MTADFDHAVVRECIRQRELKEAGRFEYEIGECEDWRSMTILLEEVGEVARALNEGDKAHAMTELVQVAACCRKWYHHLERRLA